MAAPDEASIRRDLAAVYRICDKLGLNVGVCNHHTAMLHGTLTVSSDSFGLGWDEVTKNLVACAEFGNIISGEGPVETTAIKIHAAVHLSNPQKYACVLHTHMPFTAALCTSDKLSFPCAIRTVCVSTTTSRTITNTTASSWMTQKVLASRSK